MRRRFRLAEVLATSLFACAFLFSAAAHANITENFNRADSATVGNSWVEKNAAAFAIAGNVVTKAPVGTGYRDNIVYRPSAENVADVEASVELRFTGGPSGYPQVLTRVQTGTVGLSNTLDGYIIYIADSAGSAVLGRQTGSDFVTTLANISISPALNTTDTYRLRLRTTGTSPVAVTGWVERLNGAAWQIIGTATVNDSDGARITAAGSVGFSGYVESNYSYDNFVRTNISAASNPTPATTSLSPTTATQGENGLTLTVNGSNFVNTAVVRWNGSDRATTFVSSTILEAAVSPADLATAGTRPVTVFNPAPGGGLSNAQTFTISPATTPNPVPALTTLAPNTATQGGAGFTLTVNGSNFASTAVVRWNGTNRTTTFVTPSQLSVAIPASDLATAGNVSVTVFNPSPGGGTSNAATFSVTVPNNPAPVATSLSPSSATAGGSGFTLTVNGNSFVAGSVVRWNGSSRTTTFNSANQLSASISAGDIASAGNAAVTVFSPTPGGGTSGALTFTINSSGGGGGSPVFTSMTPISANTGSGNTQVTLTGSGFTASSVVRWNGGNRTTTYLSSTSLRVTLTTADLATETLGAISVANGSTTTAPQTFFVVPAGTALFSDNFNRANSTSIGNGWTEKYDPAFSISNNEVVSIDTTPIDFHDAIVYRGSSTEDQQDVETSLEFRRTSASARFPQLHARVQRNSINQADTLNSYILFHDDTVGRMAFGIQPPTTNVDECIISTFPLPEPLQMNVRYRMRFRVQGVYPVVLTGILERYDGSQWQLVTSDTLTHDNNTPRNPDPFCPYPSVPSPISTAGTTGFAKYFFVTDQYDNYYWRSLGAPVGNSIPNVSSVAPNSATAGGSAFTLTVNGSNFSNNSTVRWNGANRTTTFISPTQLQASISAADIANVSTAAVTVFNSGSGGGTSPQSMSFNVTPPPGGGGSSFFDNFSRADSGTIGNGWIEKNVSSWLLQGNRAVKQSVGSSYHNNIVYRPASEDALNVEASAVLQITNGSPGYPQVFTRVQSGSVGADGWLDAYILYIDNATNRAILGRQRGTAFLTTLSTITLSPALNTTDTYRLRLSTSGTASVALQAYVERFNGSGWTVIGQSSFTDTSAERIPTAGSVGFGGYVEATYSYDDFTRTVLP